MRAWLWPVYVIGDLGTWVYLSVEDWARMGFFKWLLSTFVFDLFLATIWPIYWLILRPLMGG